MLKIGDKIRIVSIPSGYLHKDTRETYKKLIERNRSVRISSIDEFGQFWYNCRFKNENGNWIHHSLSVIKTDNNWIKV